MKCPACGSSYLDFRTDRFVCETCGAEYPGSKALDLVDSFDDFFKGAPGSNADATTHNLTVNQSHGKAKEPQDVDVSTLVSDLNATTWQIIGETMASSIDRIRAYGQQFDELDAENDNRMRKHLGRSISEQFDFDLRVIASRMAMMDDKVAPEELALINGALSLDFDAKALRACAESAANSTDGFFSVPPQSFVAAVVYDNCLFAETGNPLDSCSELLLQTLKTLCEEILICDGNMGSSESDRFTTLMTAIQDLLVEKLDSWEGEPRISALALSPEYRRSESESSSEGSDQSAMAEQKADDSQAETKAEAEAEPEEDEATLEELLEELNSLTGMVQVK